MEHNVESVAKHKIVNKELHIKKLACRYVLHYLTEHQKAERVKICKEILNPKIT